MNLYDPSVYMVDEYVWALCNIWLMNMHELYIFDDVLYCVYDIVSIFHCI
jgi:hypothetical protein